MATIKIRYLTSRPGATGEPRWFWQPSGPLQLAGFVTRRLHGTWAEVMAQAQRLNAEVDAWRAGATGAAPTPAHTVQALVSLYLSTPSYTSLRQVTQEGYLKALRQLTDWCGDQLASSITRPHVRAWQRNMADTPAKAALCIRVARLLFGLAVDEGWIHHNPFSKPRLTTLAPRGVQWSRDELEAILCAADRAGRPSLGTAVLMAFYLGQREGDILSLPWSSIINGRIRLRQSKTGAWVEIPLHPVLARRLENTPRTSPVMLVSESTGQPYGSDNFRHLFADLRDATFSPAQRGGKKLLFMDLRRTATINLGEAGCTEAEVAAITGHSIEATRHILETYMPRTTAMAENALHKLITREQSMFQQLDAENRG